MFEGFGEDARKVADVVASVAIAKVRYLKLLIFFKYLLKGKQKPIFLG